MTTAMADGNAKEDDEFWIPMMPAAAAVAAQPDVGAPHAPQPPQAPHEAYNFRQHILCANCGCAGHVYRECNLPITSLGLLCFRWAVAGDGVGGLRRFPQYLMVQRKFSLCFVEFVRGKYDLQNRGYIARLLESMTPVERERIRSMTFQELWYGFWQTDHSRVYARDFQHAYDKFRALKEGYYLRHPTTRELSHVTLARLLEDTVSRQTEPEWGFPKGRRNINEKDLRCALREFREETGVDVREVQVHAGLRPLEEVFTGCNRVRYRHVYYVAQIKQTVEAPAGTGLPGQEGLGGGLCEDVRLQGDRGQMREISRVSWLDAEGVLARIARHNVDRRVMFEHAHRVILSSPGLYALARARF